MDEKLERKIQVITNLIRRREAVNASTGKTAIQKIVFFIQKLGVDLGYKYILYTYGPYSVELMDDIDQITDLGYIKTVYNPDYGGYVISSGEDYTQNHLENVEKQIVEKVLDDYSGMKAKDLELRSTMLFLRTKLEIENQDLMKETKITKPSFSEEEIRIAFQDMIDKKYL